MKAGVEKSTKRQDSESFKAIIEELKQTNYHAVRPPKGLEAPPNSPTGSLDAPKGLRVPFPEISSPTDTSSPTSLSSSTPHTSSNSFFGASDTIPLEEKTTLARQFYLACKNGNFSAIDKLLRSGCTVNDRFSPSNGGYQGPYQEITPLIAAALSHNEKSKQAVITRLFLEKNPKINFIAYPKNKSCNHQPATFLDFVEEDVNLKEHLVDFYQAKTAEQLLGKSTISAYGWRNERF